MVPLHRVVERCREVAEPADGTCPHPPSRCSPLSSRPPSFYPPLLMTGLPPLLVCRGVFGTAVAVCRCATVEAGFHHGCTSGCTSSSCMLAYRSISRSATVSVIHPLRRARSSARSSVLVQVGLGRSHGCSGAKSIFNGSPRVTVQQATHIVRHHRGDRLRRVRHPRTLTWSDRAVPELSSAKQG